MNIHEIALERHTEVYRSRERISVLLVRQEFEGNVHPSFLSHGKREPELRHSIDHIDLIDASHVSWE